MSRAKSIRKSVLKKQKLQRTKNQGIPRNKSFRGAQLRQMKEFNQFIRKQIAAGKLVDHADAGLPQTIVQTEPYDGPLTTGYLETEEPLMEEEKENIEISYEESNENDQETHTF